MTTPSEADMKALIIDVLNLEDVAPEDIAADEEPLLGIGGVRMLRALGYNPAVWHMNEGHAAFLTLERAREFAAVPAEDVGEVMERIVAKNA